MKKFETFLALLLVAVIALVAVESANAATTRLLRTNCSPVASQGANLYFNERKSNGLWDAKVGDMNCANGRSLLPAYSGHRGVGDVSANGDLVVLETDKGSPLGSSYAEPGKGFGVQLQLLQQPTGRLTDLTTGRKGIIWSKLRPDGGAVAWAQMTKTALETSSLWNHLLGSWEIHVADITSAGTLTNERSWRPPEEAFVETYGWLDNKIMFASDQTIPAPWGGDWLTTQLWTIPDTLAGTPTRVSPPFRKPTWCSGNSWCSQWYTDENPYHEFMHLALPGAFPEPGTWILFGVLWSADLSGSSQGGLDLWRMRPDGTGRQRLTQFNATRYAVTGGIAPDRADPKRIVLGVSGDSNASAIDAYEVRF